MKFGHLKENDIKKLQLNYMVKGISFTQNNSLTICKVCIIKKKTTISFTKEVNYRNTGLLNLSDFDLCGLVRFATIGETFHFVTFIDEKS